MNTIAMPKRLLRSASSSRICAWMVTSSAVVGSSAISTCGPVGERHGDHDALALAAGELVRIAVQPLLGSRNADERQQFERARARRGATAHLAMGAQRLGELVADPVERIERGHRLLEDHAELAAAIAVELARRQAEDLLAADLHRAGGEAVRGQQAHDGHHGLALARAALADDGERLARRHVEARRPSRRCRSPSPVRKPTSRSRTLRMAWPALRRRLAGRCCSASPWPSLSDPSDRARRAGRRR